MRSQHSLLLSAALALALGFLSSAWAAEAPVPAKIEFNRDVRPILSDNCFYCHGNEPTHRKAKLRLDVREEALKKEAFVAGKPEESELITRILTIEPDDMMPPPDSHKKLTSRQKEVLKQWIAQGGEYQKHWSLEKLVKPMIPAGNAVDVLVQKRLAAVGLQPAPEADRRTLIRRLYADLLGLPPAPAEVLAFVNDRSPDAYARLVDTVLKNPHYGERMAIGWLDVVRYADTIGYHSDNPRNVWPYRDWVIKSFNDNKRFDRFTLEQVAGDLLADANQETQVASAFNRLLLSTEEGGAQPKDYQQRMLNDRVRAIGAAWLGQTIGCAQCHDHKFDPISQRDFYGMGAFFADIKEGLTGPREQGMLVLDSEGARKQADISQRLAALQAEFNQTSAQVVSAKAIREKATKAEVSPISWQPLAPLTAVAAKTNIALKTEKDGIVHASVDPTQPQNNGPDTYTLTATLPHGATGIRLEALKGESPGVGLAANGNFVLSEIALALNGTGKPVKLARASATFEQPSFPAANAVDGVADKKDNGWAVLGGTGADQALYLELAEPLAATDTAVTFTLTFGWGDDHGISNLRLSSTTAPKPITAPASESVDKEIAEILKLAPAQRSPAQQDKFAAAFKLTTPKLSELRTKIVSIEKEQADFAANGPKCLVSISDPNKRTVRLLPRGNWMDESGEIIKAALPHYLPGPKIEGREPTRLDLAQWLVSRENPLTARTVMNRLAKQLFGTGLSKVLDDLGAQGEPPPNQPLLDWLACEFMDSGWDFKHMVKVIVSSATYRQASNATPQQLAADPYNRELARQSPFRLDAELVRDNALAVAGLLVPTIGGPSVKPYQPEGYWENLSFPVRTYVADTGGQQYRRGLYTWWQRSFLHPSLLAFDAPSREECTAERNRSNIPQQALALLNDPTYVEAARALATRLLSECKGGSEQRFAWAWQQVLQRNPSAEERITIEALLAERLAGYRADPKAANDLLKVGFAPVPADLDKAELAAWTHVVRVLLNLHETITRA